MDIKIRLKPPPPSYFDYFKRLEMCLKEQWVCGFEMPAAGL